MKKFSLVITSIYLTFPSLVSAAPAGVIPPDPSISAVNQVIPDIIQKIVNWVLAFSAILAVLFIIIGGVQYIASGGNADQSKKARQTLTYAIIGLIIIVLSYFIVSFVVKLINGFLS